MFELRLFHYHKDTPLYFVYDTDKKLRSMKNPNIEYVLNSQIFRPQQILEHKYDYLSKVIATFTKKPTKEYIIKFYPELLI